VLDETGRAKRLHDVLGDAVVVLGFVYTSCPDINGCPLANHVLQRVQSRLLEDAGLGAQVRLVSLSFDPIHDRPEVMRSLGESFAKPGADWRLLTTVSDDALAPILEAYGQSIQREYDAGGRPLGTISHLLRVFLIDREKRIRNVYSSALLHADTVWSDVRTILAESAPSRPEPAQPREDPARLSFPAEPPLGLQEMHIPPGAEPTPERIALGRKLFFDRRLSRNATISCALCHVPAQGFTSNAMATSIGIEGRTVRRNAPSLYNAAYAERLFHDGRESSLEEQVWSPLLAADEMGNPSVQELLDRLGTLRDYDGLFEAAFEGSGPTRDHVGVALASFERTLVSGSSPFDRWRFGGEAKALSPAAQRGAALFEGKAGCVACHAIGEQTALFTDHALHDTGVGFRRAAAPTTADVEIEYAPGSRLRIDAAVVSAAREPPRPDFGLEEISGRPEDRWKYRTPSLRNVALTAPYMHDGSVRTLPEVVEYYDGGGAAHALLDARIRPLGLRTGEKEDLVAFLESLTGDDIEALVEMAEATPIGDTTSRSSP